MPYGDDVDELLAEMVLAKRVGDEWSVDVLKIATACLSIQECVAVFMCCSFSALPCYSVLSYTFIIYTFNSTLLKLKFNRPNYQFVLLCRCIQ
jgi:hypothetical protein